MFRSQYARLVILFLISFGFTVVNAQTAGDIRLKVEVLSPNYIFADTARIRYIVQNDNQQKGYTAKLKINLTTDDYRFIREDSAILKVEASSFSGKEIVYNLSAGFYRSTVQAIDEANIVISEYKFNFGINPESIESPLDGKADLKQFWENSLKELAKVEPDYKLKLEKELSNNDYELYTVTMKSFGDETIKGYYAKPKRDGNHPVIVECLGYGSGPFMPNMEWDGFAYFVVSTRGQGMNKETNTYGNWITYGLDSKDNYYYKGAFLDIIRGLDFVCSRPEVDTTRIGVMGGSQGGAFTFVAAALDKRVKVAVPFVPFLSDYKDYFAIAPWPKNDFDKFMEENKDYSWDHIYSLLSYFDIKNLAPWISCPLMMSVGIQDNVCPPHINFAAYNQVRTEKKWLAYPHSGHELPLEYFKTRKEFLGKYLLR